MNITKFALSVSNVLLVWLQDKLLSIIQNINLIHLRCWFNLLLCFCLWCLVLLMANYGIVYRKVYPQVPPKVEYSLTEFGISMRPMLDAMMTWGEQYKQIMCLNMMNAQL